MLQQIVEVLHQFYEFCVALFFLNPLAQRMHPFSFLRGHRAPVGCRKTDWTSPRLYLSDEVYRRQPPEFSTLCRACYRSQVKTGEIKDLATKMAFTVTVQKCYRGVSRRSNGLLPPRNRRAARTPNRSIFS